MTNEEISKDSPRFKPWTEEEWADQSARLDEAARLASLDLKKYFPDKETGGEGNGEEKIDRTRIIKNQMSYFLRVYDNFHDYDDEGFDEVGCFNSEQEALIEAQCRVKRSVIHSWTTGTKIDELVDAWYSFGDSPAICCTDSNVRTSHFSARGYAVEIVKQLTDFLQDDRENIQTIYQETMAFAAGKHAKINQLVPGTTIPYAVHLSNVSMEVILAEKITHNFNLKLALQAALLHDTLEDTDTTETELEEKFGIAVSTCVKALTKDLGLPKNRQMADSLRRIKNMPAEIWAVKLADRITNLQPPPSHWDDKKKIDYQEEARVILAELKDGNEFLAKRLETLIEDYLIYINN